jgi:hypothetical protein
LRTCLCLLSKTHYMTCSVCAGEWVEILSAGRVLRAHEESLLFLCH